MGCGAGSSCKSNRLTNGLTNGPDWIVSSTHTHTLKQNPTTLKQEEGAGRVAWWAELA